MNLFHTSPQKIETIKNSGIFSGALFFSCDIYYTQQSKNSVVYTINVNEQNFASLYDLEPSDQIIDDIKHMFNALFNQDIDNDEALDYLLEDENIFDQGLDCESASEFSWFIQGMQAKTARDQGFLGVESEDEQGAVYIINMVGKEDLLEINNA